MTPRITLISTVLNEGESIHWLMQSIVTQRRQPDEVIIVDGGSRDQTVDILNSYADRLPLRVIVEPGCNISAGRNTAIRKAQTGLIAVTDAGVQLAPDWLQSITQPMIDNPKIQMVGGFFHADPHTIFEAAMGATVLPLVTEITPDKFLPSSRSVAFHKSAWEQVEGYPEWIDYCEDLIFDLRMKAVIGTNGFAFAPQAVAHFRPRSSLRAFYKQYYLYARGDGKADLWRKRHLIRYVTYLIAAPLLLGLALWVHPIFWGILLIAALVYLAQPYRRLPVVMRQLSSYRSLDWLYVALLIPVIRVVGDVAKMIGYPVGWRWRLKNHPPKWRENGGGGE